MKYYEKEGSSIWAEILKALWVGVCMGILVVCLHSCLVEGATITKDIDLTVEPPPTIMKPGLGQRPFSPKMGERGLHKRKIIELDLFLQKIVNVLQGRVSFGDATDGEKGENILGEFQNKADTGSADTEFSLTHALGYIPTGFLVVKNDKAGVVYESGTTWTLTTVYFKCSTANCDVMIFLF